MDVEALSRAIQVIIDRHESLRTSFAEVDGTPVQVIAASVPFEIPIDDLRQASPEAQERLVAAALRAERTTAFDLTRAPLLRMRLLQLADDRYVLIRTHHHIVSDGWSEAIFNRELGVVYAAECAGRPHPLPPLPCQYADFALWQRSATTARAIEAGLTYWCTQLAGLPERLELATDRPRPPRQTFAAASWRMTLSEPQTTALKRLCQTQQTTMYMTMLAAFAVLLSRYSGQTDIVIGSPIAHRPDPDHEHVIGMFLNTVAMRLRVDPGGSFEALLKQTRQTVLDALQYQHVPFERIVEQVAPKRSLQTTPLVQAEFAFQSVPTAPLALDNVDVVPLNSDVYRIRFDLEVRAIERNNTIDIIWLFKQDLFDAWRIEQMGKHFALILNSVSQDVVAT